MKKNLLIAFALIISLMACKKDKPAEPEVEDRKPEVLIKAITEKLAAADSISTFTNALKSMALKAEETAQGITVFAPLNESAAVPGRLGKVSSAGSVSGTRTVNAIAEAANVPQLVLTDSVLRDHIVKGVFKLADLTDGKILTGLSGKQLKVSRSADTIWINGVQIGGKEILNTNNEVVYTVKSVLTATAVTDQLQSTSIEIKVWDGTLWTTAKPKGEVLAGATVSLYRTQQNYADSVTAYSSTSDASGKALFKSITPGTYYVKVSSGVKSNIFNRSAKQAGLYAGFASAGIFQSQAEITAAPAQTGAQPGDFKWVDANGDGVVDNNDRVTLPYEHTVAANGTLKKIEVSIGMLHNKQLPLLTEQEFLTGLASAENNIASWQKNLAIADGLLSHQAVIDSIPLVFKANYQSFGTFTFTPTNQGITQIWQQGYAQITALNTLQEKAPVAMTKRSEKISRLKATRAYVYLQLLTYFGNIPLIQQTTNLTNTNRTAVYNFITAELESAADSLSLAPSGAANLNGLSVKVLLAKAALLEKEYTKVADLTNYVLNSAQYSLAGLAAQFNAGNAELIWDNSANIDANVKSYFFNRPTLPYLRLTEVYLMSAEANIAMGNTTNAQARYAALLQRSSITVTAINQANLRTLWTNEMRREGVGFANLNRWGTTADELARYGFVPGKHLRLPIPQVIIDQHPGMVQNSGY
ncbi:fasciclin domain-containing protein [Pedobacter heparinus]|uniref:fasciclin domain-containing protein n=1 Tax=Pedobacter heparinus TaxID=984 RepID=UPI0029310EA1|nr:fasciclin domain-containing protein [Pedobacter heparinus]